MTTVNILKAKKWLSRLVTAVESGVEPEIILTRDGKPVARIVPLPKEPEGHRIGLLAGKFTAPVDFDADNATIAAMFRRGD